MRRGTLPTVRAALYARVSTVGKGQDVGLQLEELRRVAEQRGWAVTAEFVDDGVSGRKDSRPGLDAMLAEARAGKLDVIAVWKLDRLGRSLAHLLRVTSDLTAWNVDLVSIRDAGIDTTTANGKLLLAVLGAFAQFEADLTRERVTAGVRRVQAAGKHCGRPFVDLDLRPALALFDKGHGIKAVATMLGVSRSTLRARLVEAGEWPRKGVENPVAGSSA